MPTAVLYLAHPQIQHSRINRALVDSVRDLAGLECVDLYELYPDFYIDVQAEQERLRRHQLIILQHPFYWYSCPPLLKEWLDSVLSRGFAYGEGEKALTGKDYLQVITTGGQPWLYGRDGLHRFTMMELLRPFEATAKLCGLSYHHPFLVQGSLALAENDLREIELRYRRLLTAYIQNGRKALLAYDSIESTQTTVEAYI